MPVERTLRARIGAYSLHAQRDSRETTRAARAAALSRFDVMVDPDGVLAPEERARRAEAARKAYFARLALKSAKTRQKKAARGKLAANGGRDVRRDPQ
jgi:hypothetical protein